MSLFDRISRRKYYHESKLSDGTPLVWPGTPDGIPYAGKVIPNLRGSEIDDIRYQLNFHAKWFNLAQPQELEEYCRIKDKIKNGLYVEYRQKDIDQPDGSIKTFLEWGEIYAEGSPSDANF